MVMPAASPVSAKRATEPAARPAAKRHAGAEPPLQPQAVTAAAAIPASASAPAAAAGPVVASAAAVAAGGPKAATSDGGDAGVAGSAAVTKRPRAEDAAGASPAKRARKTLGLPALLSKLQSAMDLGDDAKLPVVLTAAKEYVDLSTMPSDGGIYGELVFVVGQLLGPNAPYAS